MGSFKQQKDDDELYGLLRPGRNTYLKIAEVMDNTNHAAVILLVENISHHRSTRTELLRYLKTNDYAGIYVTLNTPITTIMDIFEKIKKIRKTLPDLSCSLYLLPIQRINSIFRKHQMPSYKNKG